MSAEFSMENIDAAETAALNACHLLEVSFPDAAKAGVAGVLVLIGAIRERNNALIAMAIETAGLIDDAHTELGTPSPAEADLRAALLEWWDAPDDPPALAARLAAERDG